MSCWVAGGRCQDVTDKVYFGVDRGVRGFRKNYRYICQPLMLGEIGCLALIFEMW